MTLSAGPSHDHGKDRQELILDAVLHILAREGISGVSIRSVGREAGVAHGLVGYYYVDKVGLIGAALRRIDEEDNDLVRPDPALSPAERLQWALRRVADPEFLTADYLRLRLQLWSLAKAEPEFEVINNEAQARYREALATLIRDAYPELPKREVDKRATDINLVQNGLWLTALLGMDRPSVKRAIKLTEQIAAGLPPAG